MRLEDRVIILHKGVVILHHREMIIMDKEAAILMADGKVPLEAEDAVLGVADVEAGDVEDVEVRQEANSNSMD